MAKRLTRQVRTVRLPEARIREIEDLVASWPQETKAFMRARLHQYKPPTGLVNAALDGLVSLFVPQPPRAFRTLKDPAILTDWQRRFELSGETNPRQAWNRILEKEVSASDYHYLLWLLDRELSDVFVPEPMRRLFEKLYRAFLRKEYLKDPEVPKAPLVLVIGPSGSGKSATVTQAIEEVIFRDEVRPEVDLKLKKEERLRDEPFWRTLEAVDPTLAEEIHRRRKLRFYRALARTPVVRRVFQKRIGRHLAELEEQGIWVDYSVVTPNDYQTALAGEPGNFFRKAMGDPRRTSIRHVEEAHAAFGRADDRGAAVASQQQTLVDTANIILDEIIQGRRDCLLVATTDQPERIDAAIYRRFVEKGRIIEVSEFWQEPENLREVIRIELRRNDIAVGPGPAPGRVTPEDLAAAVERMAPLFTERALKLTPAYVRKLVHSVIEIKGDFRPGYLDDPMLMRTAFEQVARNAYGDLYKRVVDRMDRRVGWDEYVGEIKNLFSEMANNCLYYGAAEEKGVVLSGPPGSGKTFLVRAWLSENRDVHDISVRPTDLMDPANPIDGTVQNLERVYDIAKMIAPAVVFFDEADAIAPRRSASGGSPQDKITNKFLNIIDGEVPLNRVFTVLTTNRLDILDPALVRSKRLKALEVTGHLRKADILGILEKRLEGVPLGPGLDLAALYEAAAPVSQTPADFAAFVEKAVGLRRTEFEVILRLRALVEAPNEAKENFVKFNLKTLAGILEAVDAPHTIRSDLKARPLEFLKHYYDLLGLLEGIERPEDYPLTRAHLLAARQELGQSPTKKGKVQLDEFLGAELSQEPQVGFIIGVGANDVTGMLLPIATSLMYNFSPEKVLVTGAVSSSAPNAAELDMAVQMTQQSAKEAFTLVENYLQSLAPRINVPRVLGEFLDRYTIHHQLLSASYTVGGPSAGYALAINTLSALLHLPVANDFGITGAPWTKGVKRGEVGSSVIIGGHKKKAEKVLQHLRRMYMPLQNYRDLETDYLLAYWEQGKDILGVTHFGDLVPEVLWLGEDYEEKLERLVETRIRYKLRKYRGEPPPRELKQEILELKAELRAAAEEELVRRIDAIRAYLQTPDRDPHLSLEEIFRHHRSRRLFGLVGFRTRWRRPPQEVERQT